MTGNDGFGGSVPRAAEKLPSATTPESVGFHWHRYTPWKLDHQLKVTSDYNDHTEDIYYKFCVHCNKPKRRAVKR